MELLFLLLAVPVGLLIAWLADDELRMGKKYIKALVILSGIATLFFSINSYNPEALTAAFMTIVAGISILKVGQKH